MLCLLTPLLRLGGAWAGLATGAEVIRKWMCLPHLFCPSLPAGQKKTPESWETDGGGWNPGFIMWRTTPADQGHL